MESELKDEQIENYLMKNYLFIAGSGEVSYLLQSALADWAKIDIRRGFSRIDKMILEK